MSPSSKRLPIKSQIAERGHSIIKNALMREMSRDGHAYFIHNRVESIQAVAKELEKLVPEAHVVSRPWSDGPRRARRYHAFKKIYGNYSRRQRFEDELSS